MINSRLGIGVRHITISTVGIIPKIKQLADDLPQVCLFTNEVLYIVDWSCDFVTSGYE